MSANPDTIATYNARAAASGVALCSTPQESELLGSFVRHTGRPIPKIMVVGRRLASQVREFEEIGADAIGVDAAESAVSAAKKAYPSLNFRWQMVARVSECDFDGIWTENLISRIPASEFDSLATSLLGCLSPGGLLRLAVRVGQGEQSISTAYGQVLLRLAQPKSLQTQLAGLDCTLLESLRLEDGRVGMIFRKEY